MKKEVIILLIISILILIPFSVFSQTRADLERRRTKAVEEIQYINKLLSQTKKSQEKSYSDLLLINNKIESRRSIILNIKGEIRLVENRIRETQNIIESLEDDLDKLKDEYAKMIRIAWKNQKTLNNLMFVFSSESFNQTYLRFRHMQQLAEYRKKQFKAIDYVQHVLEINLSRMAEIQEIKRNLLVEAEAESQLLNSEQQVQKEALSKLEKEEKDLKTKLRNQQRQAERLQKEIEKLIAEEAKRTSGSATGTYALTPAEQIISTNFGNNRGKLPWPVERGVVVSHFGKQNHPVLRNIEIDNKGIDIATTVGSTARAIFDGEVRRVLSIPGAHRAVIIRHGEYLSVYTNLDNVFVDVGDKVITKQSIGTVYTDKNENKTILHIEIWKDNTTLNPSLWLSR